jgi:hypothetical protein
LPSLVVVRGGKVVAYVTFRMRGDRLIVNEAGCQDGTITSFRLLAAAVVERAVAESAVAIEARLPRRHGLLSAVEAIVDRPSETIVRQSMMVRPIDLLGLVRSSLPELSHRVQIRWPHGSPWRSLAVRVNESVVRFTVGPEGLAVDGQAADRSLRLPSELFFRLYFGDRPVQLLDEEFALLELALSADEIELLDALFPPCDPVYWYADHY